MGRPTSQRWAIALGAVCLLGLALRLYGLGYGLPAVYNPDETPILNRALAFAKGDLNPHNFLYPSLYFYALFAWEGLFFVAGRALGLFGSLAAFQRAFFTDPSRLFLAGRALTVAFGVLTIPAVFELGRRLYGVRAGLAAALLLAVAPLAVRDAHYIKLDVPVTFFLVLTLAALARIVAEPDVAGRRVPWVAAGVLAGLTVSTHYYAAFVVCPVIAAAVVQVRRSGAWRRGAALLAWAAAGAFAGFVAGTPFFLAEPATALRDIVAVRQVDVDRAVVHGAFTSLGPYLRLLAIDALGWPVFAAGMAGAVWALVSDWRRGLLLVSFPIAFLAFVSNTVPESRYLNVLVPIVAVLAAFALTQIARGLGRRAPAMAAVLVLAAAAPGFAASLRTDRFFLQTDTRTEARAYIETHVPPGATILIQPYSVPLRQSREGLLEALRANLGDPSRASIKFQLQLGVHPYPAPAYRTIFLGDHGADVDKIYVSPRAFTESAGLAPLRTFQVDYVVLKRYNVADPAMQGLVAALAREGTKVAEFSPYRAGAGVRERQAAAPFLHNTAARIVPALERPGPIIEIWRIN